MGGPVIVKSDLRLARAKMKLSKGTGLDEIVIEMLITLSNVDDLRSIKVT